MPKHFRGTKREERALSAYVKLLRASDSLQNEAMRSLAGEDVTPTQFAVLEALYHVGPMCLSELARKILKTGGNLTMVMRNLQRRGLVVRHTNADDRRFVSVAISDKGRALITRIFPGHAARIAELMGRLTGAQQDTLGELCRQLGKPSLSS
jgi:MarR family transcriptional regulator, 2-MHQ and catechol-resistance regulon repressor